MSSSSKNGNQVLRFGAELETIAGEEKGEKKKKWGGGGGGTGREGNLSSLIVRVLQAIPVILSIFLPIANDSLSDRC